MLIIFILVKIWNIK